MHIDVEKLSLEELLDLNGRIVRRVKYLYSLRTRAHLDRFVAGDRVSFQSDGHTVEGFVVRVNARTLSIRTKDSNWKIPPRFVTRLPAPGADAPPVISEIEARRNIRDTPP